MSAVSKRKPSANVKKYYKVLLKSVNKVTKRVVERTYLIPESALDQDVRKNLQATAETNSQVRFVPNLALGRHLKSTLLASLNHKTLTPSQTQATVLDAFSKDNSRAVNVERQFSIRKPLHHHGAQKAVGGRIRRLKSTFPANYENKALTSSYDHSRNVLTSTRAQAQALVPDRRKATVQNQETVIVQNQQQAVFLNQQEPIAQNQQKPGVQTQRKAVLRNQREATVQDQQNKVVVASRYNPQGLLIREFPLRGYYQGENPAVGRRNNPSQTAFQNQPSNVARMSQNLRNPSRSLEEETLRGSPRVNPTALNKLQGGNNLPAQFAQNQPTDVTVQKRPQARVAPSNPPQKSNQNLFVALRRRRYDSAANRTTTTPPLVNLQKTSSSSSSTQDEEDEELEMGNGPQAQRDQPIINKIILLQTNKSSPVPPTRSVSNQPRGVIGHPPRIKPTPGVPGHSPVAYKCKTCAQNFDTLGKLRGHRYVHRKRPYECERCGKSFPILSRLNVHMSIHMEEKKFRCDVCGKIYKTKSSLRLHACTNTITEGGYACKICSRKFYRLQSLKNHVKTVHLNVKYKCGVCHKEYRQSGSLKIHERRHDPHFVAPELKCERCGATFTFKAALTQHRLSVHEGKLIVCDVCGKGITSWTSFQSHLRTHTGEKPFVCETCGKAFGSRKLLIIHIRIHTKEKPYPCKLCGKRFSQFGSAKIHLLRVHRREKQFRCDICSKMFMSKAQLKTHTKSHGIPSSELGTKAKIIKS